MCLFFDPYRCKTQSEGTKWRLLFGSFFGCCLHPTRSAPFRSLAGCGSGCVGSKVRCVRSLLPGPCTRTPNSHRTPTDTTSRQPALLQPNIQSTSDHTDAPRSARVQVLRLLCFERNWMAGWQKCVSLCNVADQFLVGFVSLHLISSTASHLALLEALWSVFGEASIVRALECLQRFKCFHCEEHL